MDQSLQYDFVVIDGRRCWRVGDRLLPVFEGGERTWRDDLTEISDAEAARLRPIVQSHEAAVTEIRRDRTLNDETKTTRIRQARERAEAEISAVVESIKAARSRVAEHIAATEKAIPASDIDAVAAGRVSELLKQGRSPAEIARRAVGNKDLATYRALRRELGYIDGITPGTISEIERLGKDIVPEQERDLIEARQESVKTFTKFDARVKQTQAEVMGDDAGAFRSTLEAHYADQLPASADA